ncbi:serendipity locus protein alpha [Onthophagus taurus]|uniref:serendipity locus protein alpha n=1 Tax=Onthophagus taurus TaxID=166361 RepID=UPI0039BE8947
MSDVSEKIGVCLEKFNSINTAYSYKSKVDWFNEFCVILSDLLMTVANLIKKSSLDYVKDVKRSLLLYLQQLTTLLSLLIKIFLHENDIKEMIHEARYFVIKQLQTCFEGISLILINDRLNKPNGSFLKYMDLSLDKLSQINAEINNKNDLIKNYHAAKDCIEEVLCYAMSIAQVSSIDDSKVIKGNSKAVLEELESLLVELNKDEIKINFCNLFIDCCYDKLCVLEKKVNFAVLKLSLKVFCDYTKPVLDLNNFCLNKEKDEEQFDELIINLDNHVDRIMQVGLFAIAASPQIKIGIQMESCLASLEALEGELVPSFNRLLLNPNLQSKNYSYLLEQFWIQQANNLKELIYNIIDPFAFCQVVYEELKLHIIEINDYLKNESTKISYSDKFKVIIKENWILVDLIGISIKEMDLDNKKDIEKNLNEVKLILNEIKSANILLLVNKSEIEANNIQRVFKRVKILKGTVRKLLFSLSNTDLKNDLNSPGGLNDKTDSFFDDDNKKLNQFVDRGKEILTERSILYKTPSKKLSTRNCQTSLVKCTKKLDLNRPMPLLKTIHLRNLHFSYSKVESDLDSKQSDLQITDILNELDNISSSFSNTF